MNWRVGGGPQGPGWVSVLYVARRAGMERVRCDGVGEGMFNPDSLGFSTSSCRSSTLWPGRAASTSPRPSDDENGELAESWCVMGSLDCPSRSCWVDAKTSLVFPSPLLLWPPVLRGSVRWGGGGIGIGVPRAEVRSGCFCHRVCGVLAPRCQHSELSSQTLTSPMHVRVRTTRLGLAL